MKQYIIDKPENCQTWFVWDKDMKEMLKTGSLETIAKFLEEREGVKDAE